MKVEQADGKSKYHGDYHYCLKRMKVRQERREAKLALKRGEEPIPDHKYRGWEM